MHAYGIVYEVPGKAKAVGQFLLSLMNSLLIVVVWGLRKKNSGHPIRLLAKDARMKEATLF